MHPKELDLIQFEVIRNALVETTKEMSLSLRRTAYSTNIKTRADFSCALFDRRLRLIAQAFNQPNHLGAIAVLVPRAVQNYGADRLGPGDALVTNHPFMGGSHLNDVTLISPIFRRDALIGYVANVAHHVDVGGGAPASIGAFQEIYQEGIIIPPVRLMQGGKIIPDVLQLILEQIRSTRETAGDIRAQFAANSTGARRMEALVERYDLSVMETYIEELLRYTERRVRADLKGLKCGSFSADGYLDYDGFTDQPVHLFVRVAIDGEVVVFDFTGSDVQRRAPVNSTYSQTYSGCAYALKCLIDPDVPVNSAFYGFVHIEAPEGTVVNCQHPAPVVGGWETQQRLTDIIFKALAHEMPDRVPAGTKAMICHAGFGGVDPRTHKYYCFLETLAGGYGGRIRSDGPDAVQTHGQNTENAPVEETEFYYPVQILRYELVNDSEGAGKYRGGLGLRRDYLFRDHEVSFTILADRDRSGPWGLFGGLPGRRASYILNPDGEAIELRSKTTVQLKPGDIVSYRTCGGGGYGSAFERDPAAVLNDVRDGKVSEDRARSVYGVVIDAREWAVDCEETAHLRNLGSRATTHLSE